MTQYLNLLELPDEIIGFLKANKDQESVLRYFTERRLRELTRLKGNERRMKKFRKMKYLLRFVEELLIIPFFRFLEARLLRTGEFSWF